LTKVERYSEDADLARRKRLDATVHEAAWIPFFRHYG
jgi:hypothetical protein